MEHAPVTLTTKADSTKKTGVFQS